MVRLVEHTGWSQQGILIRLSRIHKFIKSMTEMRFQRDAESNLGPLVLHLWFIHWKSAPFEFEMKHTHTHPYTIHLEHICKDNDSSALKRGAKEGALDTPSLR